MPHRIAKYLGKDAEIREIEMEYHIYQLAENSEDMVRYQADLLHLHAEAADALAQRHDRTEQVVSDISTALNAISSGLSALNETAGEQLWELRDANRTLDTIRHHLVRASVQLAEQQATLTRIEQVLGKPYETKALELRKEAAKWLRQGAAREVGRERDADWDDALRLLTATTENPLGMQDYVVWFQIGWLTWKHKNDPRAAEEAFFRAQRLSAPAQNEYYLLSLLHQAYMQHQQSDYQGAYDTAQKALAVDDGHRTLYDASRYATRAGYADEAYDLLGRALDKHPPLYISMLAEEDFR